MGLLHSKGRVPYLLRDDDLKVSVASVVPVEKLSRPSPLQLLNESDYDVADQDKRVRKLAEAPTLVSFGKAVVQGAFDLAYSQSSDSESPDLTNTVRIPHDDDDGDLRRVTESFWSVFWFTLGQFLSRILSWTIYSLSKNWLYNVFVGWFPVFLTKFHFVRNTFTFNLSASFLAFAFVSLCFTTIHRFQKDLSRNLKANDDEQALVVPDNAFFYRMFYTAARPDHINTCLVLKWVICFTLGTGSLCFPIMLTYLHIIE